MTFLATGVAASPASIVVLSLQSQTATVAVPVASVPSVRVLDGFGNNVSGVTVNFAVLTGGGSPIGATPITDASGIATIGSWTPGSAAGTQTIKAVVSGIALPATFSANAEAGAPAAIIITAGDGQSGAVGTPLPILSSIFVTDAFANPVPGVTVTFAASGCACLVTGAVQVTNAAGIASVGSWAPAQVGINQL